TTTQQSRSFKQRRWELMLDRRHLLSCYNKKSVPWMDSTPKNWLQAPPPLSARHPVARAVEGHAESVTSSAQWSLMHWALSVAGGWWITLTSWPPMTKKTTSSAAYWSKIHKSARRLSKTFAPLQIPQCQRF